MVKILDFFSDKSVLLIVIGAMPGALLRWQINNDFASNIFGAAVLGLIVGLQSNQKMQLIFVFGFCGALTTFSGWMITALKLFLQGFLWQTFFVISGTLMAGFLSLLLGFFMGQKLRQSFSH